MSSRKKARSACLIIALLFAVSCFIYPIGYLSASTDATFTITAPAAGDVLAAGSEYTITWNYTGNPGEKVNLTLYKEGKSSYRIASNVPVGSGGSGSYTWKVNSVYVPEGSSYTIRIFTPSSTNRVEAFSPTFSVTHQASGQQSNQNQNSAGDNQTAGQSSVAETTIINDASFATLKAVPNPGGGSDSLYKLQVQANDSASPVEVSYLILSLSGSPDNPSTGIKTGQLTESENGWSGTGQTYSHTEVGGWARPEYGKNPQSFALPHYRTCVMMLARYEKIYVVFIRENDGKLSYQVFKGGAFNGLNVPGLGQVTRSGSQLQIHSEGGAVEVGIWDKGAYQHDEVTGWARESYQANDKTYPIPQYGMFMMTIARYGKMGLIMGNFNDGRLGTVCFSGSSLLGSESVSGLCKISKASASNIEIRGTGSDPVEVSQFAFDNTCWQWEVNGWGQEAFQANPQVLPLKHYTPGFITCSRYGKAGVFFYNENDGNLGILPLNSSTQASAAGPAQQSQNASGQPGTSSQSDAIKVYVNGKLLSFDQPPVIIGGRTLVPMGTIFKALGAMVSWDAVNQMVLATKGDITIKLIIGEGTAQVNGHETALSQPAQIIGGRTMVPLGFVAQALQADVKWDGDTRTININQKQESSGTAELTFNGKQVVDMFFSSLGSREVDDAMSLMDAELLGNDATKAAWRNLFNSFDTLQVKSITDWKTGEWTLDQQAFKVEFALQLKNGAPETMWMDGLNTRWVFVKPVNGQGKISQLATGP